MRTSLTLFVLLFACAFTAPMTAAAADSSSGLKAFNSPLSRLARKSTPARGEGVRTLVIDAGHGGRDPGGLGRNCQEKDIALGVAKLLANGIRANYPDVKVVMTREDDTFVPLGQRARIANEAGADLFISLHANTARNRAAYGTETFVMGNHVEGYNLEVTKRENAAARYESADEAVYVNPNSSAGHIVMRARQRAAQEGSIHFAGMVEKSFSKSGRHSRGVKQSGFLVLKATTMPSVLVELGFMTNANEEYFLRSQPGKEKLADALLEAFGEFHRERGGKALARTSPPPAQSQAVRDTTPVTPASVWMARKVPQNVIKYTQPEDVELRVQLAATKKRVSFSAQGWDKLDVNVEESFDGKFYRYQINGIADADAARKQVAALKAAGIRAIIVGYAGEQRLDARRLHQVLSK